MSKDSKDPFVDDSAARVFATRVRGWSMKNARADIERGGRAFNHARLTDGIEDLDLRVPYVRAPETPEDLAIQAVIAEEIDKLIDSGPRRLRGVGEWIREGLNLAEIDQLHGGTGATAKAWERFKKQLARNVARRLHEKDT